MGALTAQTRDDFIGKARQFAKRLRMAVRRADDREVDDLLFDALMRAAKKGAQHSDWFHSEPLVATPAGDVIAVNDTPFMVTEDGELTQSPVPKDGL